jgi:hypothetical protein
VSPQPWLVTSPFREELRHIPELLVARRD